MTENAVVMVRFDTEMVFMTLCDSPVVGVCLYLTHVF